jgi:hypothetical protein
MIRINISDLFGFKNVITSIHFFSRPFERQYRFFRFGDYWRMGLPVDLIVVSVGLPMLMWVWPL